MSKKILVETYILIYAPKDLPWYKIEGLMAYIVQLKHEKFEKILKILKLLILI